MIAKTRKQQICEFLLNNPDSTTKQMETALGMGHNLLSVHLVHLKKKGLIENSARGKYHLKTEGMEVAMKMKLPKNEFSPETQKTNSPTEPLHKQTEKRDKERQPPLYRITIQGKAFAHDAIVEEELARMVVNLLINKKKR